MPTPESPSPSAARVRREPAAVLRAGARAGLLLVTMAAAGSLVSSGAAAQKDGGRVPRHASPALENAARYMMSLPAKTDAVVLAVQGTQEGHWRFVNRAGEMYTVGTPDEMKRVLSVLYPEAKPAARVSLYLTEDTIFRHRATLKALPAGAELSMVVGGESYRLLRRSEPAGERPFAEVRSGVALQIGEQRLFREALWQLGRPLGRARVRVLALEPGGPAALAGSPRIDPATRKALVDVIDPTRLLPALGSVSGQMLVILGRVEGDLLYVRPSKGPEHVLPLNDLFKAAADADVNLIVLQAASTPRQPGGPNRLWDAEGTLQRAQVADLLSGLASPRVAVAIAAAGERTLLDLAAAADLPGAPPARQAGERLSAIVADLTHRAVLTGARASLLSAERQQELDRRILSFVPAALQIGYVVLVFVGLLGMPVARAWWLRIWPAEVADEYAGRAGYWAACTVRGLVFLLLFLPVTAAVAAPYNLARQIGEAVRAPGRGWRWRGSRGADREAARPPPLPPGYERPTFDQARLRSRASGR